MSTIHRFYIGDINDRSGPLDLTTELWVNDRQLVTQILRVLRMRPGEQIVLFNGYGKEVLYKIAEIEPEAFKLEKITDLVVKLPRKKITLGWSMLKKDKNDWVLQKCTELGVSHFVPLLSERTEKTGFDIDRAKKIVIEAAEQCGRHNIPTLSEPADLVNYLNQHKDSSLVFIADMGGNKLPEIEIDSCAVVVGPEGGWSDNERALFEQLKLPLIKTGDFTLRAETACIVAVQSVL